VKILSLKLLPLCPPEADQPPADKGELEGVDSGIIRDLPPTLPTSDFASAVPLVSASLLRNAAFHRRFLQ
jgi:hypothetical protein